MAAIRSYQRPDVALTPPIRHEWEDDALCTQLDPEMFFPDIGGSTKAAKSICAQCTVRAECLEWALAKDERFGVYGGKSERERQRLRVIRAAAAREAS